eukprot:TRINITY_DN448_c0_g1_i2.p1 TRINITY_DN448_c0_g1~~TRINITY_DN448_c0_g1_i2.p1  ORF type:complete len:473 (+),score=131.14 TRINITY_DN448_c0_g1_i2:161-1579(+)
MSSAKAVAFLAKKSWHTGTMRHMEKVWKAQVRHEQEEKKTQELRRELMEEREIEELRKQNEKMSGTARPDRVDFLYQGPVDEGPSPEEYLTGRQYKDPNETDVKKMQHQPGALWLSDPLDLQNDKRTKIREDPLFSIKREEFQMKEKLRNNPVKMKKIKEMLQKKEAEKKERKRKRKSDSDVKRESDSDSDYERRKKKRRKSDSDNVWEEVKREKDIKVEPKHHVDNHNSREDNDRGRDRDRPEKSRSDRDHSRERSVRDRSDRDRSDRGRDKPDRDRSRDRSDKEGSRMERSKVDERERDRGRDRSRDRSDRDRSDKDRPERDRSDRDRSRERTDRSSHRDNSREDNSDRRHRDNSRERGSSHKNKEQPNKKKSKKLTPEELEQRRLAMEQDAEQVQKQRIEKVMKYTEEESKERQNYLTTEQKTGLGPSFLNSMGKEVYEDKTTASLEDRVKRGRHYVQKTNLDERGMFN